MGLREVTPDELAEILERHKLWLDTEGEEGERADLQEANLRGANLQRADLQRANLQEADLRGAYLQWANLRGANLRGATLQGANLRGADLQEAGLQEADLRGATLQWATLQGAILDFSSLPLWCGGLRMKTDRRIMAQIAYHFCNQDCSDPDYLAARNAILDFANGFHRVEECGELERIEPEKEREEDACE